MMAPQVDIEQSGPVITVRVGESEVTHLRMQELVNECLERKRYHSARHVIMDMSGVTFLSSACLGPIVNLLQELEHVRGRLAMIHCSDEVAFLMHVTRLDSVIGVYDDADEARKHMA